LVLNKTCFTMRAGGTSIGGQAIGNGVIVDISKHLNSIFGFSQKNKEVSVEPGVIQDDLNDYLKLFNLKFAPDTSTSNRAMIGGMIGNNSCGSYSLLYGTTREHIKSVEVVLSNGDLVVFKELNGEELKNKLKLKTLEGDIYRYVINILDKNQSEILEMFPDESLIRRNTGYALDVLIRRHQPFNGNGKRFNLTPLICGSEGTLGVIVSAKLNLVNLPLYKGLLVAHFNSDKEALKLVEKIVKFKPSAVEYIDKQTLDSSKSNIQQKKNRSWINKDPQSVLIIEFFSDNKHFLNDDLNNCKKYLLKNRSYHVELVNEIDHYKVWEIRKAGLGLLMGRVGSKKAVAVIEDVAVPLKHLYSYYQDIKALMDLHSVNAIYYGHASVGLIHVRPELDLSSTIDQIKMTDIAKNVSIIVKKYKGSLSGEHGDGRIRAPYLQYQFGASVYKILTDLKNIFDPYNLLNPGVIISNQDILKDIREVGTPKQSISSFINWDKDSSYYYAVEKCNGAGVCKKSIGRGIMCPSYKATREESLSTRGRANLLRIALQSNDPVDALNSKELAKALDTCLSCKACLLECPASVNMARLKSEYLFQTQKQQDQFKLQYIKNLGKILKYGSKNSRIFNFLQNSVTIKKIAGIKRDLPEVKKETVASWWSDNESDDCNYETTVWLVCDLFTQYYDLEIGKSLLTFLKACKVNIRLIDYKHSIVAMISNGLLPQAKDSLEVMRDQLKEVSKRDLIVGIEPSEVLVWRDEAHVMINGPIPEVLLFEEALLKLNDLSVLPKLKTINNKVWIHEHCHQKSLAKTENIKKALSLIPNIEFEFYGTGCCGMAGDFGYKHPELSVKIAHQTFDIFVDGIGENDIVVNTGFSCRKQVLDVFSINSIHLSQVFAKSLHAEEKSIVQVGSSLGV
jgi:FAD/FMN-containing dehydrogenase/Fe-S oxidoreductase